MSARHCGHCGAVLAPTATFCRHCGNRYEPPPPPRPRGTPSRALIVAAVAIVLTGAGAAIAIILSAGGADSTTTVVEGGGAGGTQAGSDATTSSSGQSAPGSVSPGSYVQAGSFKFNQSARAEQGRLAGQGVTVEVLPSELAQELYPGFEVLLVGPLSGAREGKEVARTLHRKGVPSAFVRSLTPAAEVDQAAAGGRWTGSLTESSAEHPNRNRSLAVSLTVNSDGGAGVLDLPKLSCQISLSAAPAPGPYSLEFDQQAGGCLGSGTWHVRPSASELTMTMLPRGTDIIILGSLQRG